MNDETEVPQSANLIDLIDRLVEPTPPPSVSMAPETVGWVVLAVVLALAAAWALWRIVVRWRANAYRRAALASLRQAGDDPAAIAEVLRRAALAAWPRDQVAGLTGAAWLQFLDESGRQAVFLEGPGAAIATAPYTGNAAEPGLSDLAADWIRRHRVEAVS